MYPIQFGTRVYRNIDGEHRGRARLPKAGANSIRPLHIAAASGDAHSVRAFLDKGVPVDVRDAGGKTPLHWAAALDLEAMAEGATIVALVERGADVNARTNGGTTALHEAASAGNVIAVKILLKHGADPLARDDRGATPERYARDAKHKAVAEVLRAASAGQTKGRSNNAPD